MTPPQPEHNPYDFFSPLLDCDCQVCKDAQEKHDAAVAAQARDEFAKELSEQIELTYSKSGVMNVCDLLEYIEVRRRRSDEPRRS